MDEHRPEDSRCEAGEPAARFQRFEKVLVTDTAGTCHPGTILWRDLVQYSQYGSPDAAGSAAEVVGVGVFGLSPRPRSLHHAGRVPAAADGRIRSGGSPPGPAVRDQLRHGPGRGRGHRRGELSRPRRDSGRSSSSARKSVHRASPPLREWASGITGIHFEVPGEDDPRREYMLRAFADVFGTEDWVEVRGPDSLLMK